MELKEVMQEIEKNGYQRIGVQSPDGLKYEAMAIAQELRKKGKMAVLVAASSFGACDLADEKVMKLECECLIHLGHSKFYVGGKAIEGDIPVFYLVRGFDWPIIPILEKHLDEIEEKRIGLITVAQHMHKLPEVKEFLESKGKVVFIGEEGTRTHRKGQILGCDSSTAQKIAGKVDAFVYIGSGYFHPIKVIDTGKKVYKVDPLEGSMSVVGKEMREKELRKELAKVMKYADEEKWGIILSTKKGQFFPQMADTIRQKLESFGKEAYFFIGDRVFESDLIGFGVKIFVNTACPRMPPDFTEVAVVNPWALKALDEYYSDIPGKESKVIENQDN